MVTGCVIIRRREISHENGSRGTFPVTRVPGRDS